MADVQNPPAFPVHPASFIEGGEGKPWLWEGMTLRDWFAGQLADQAFRFALGHTPTAEASPMPMAARLAYEFADAMLAERAKSEALDSQEVSNG